jgi:formylglycine-generating enzyme required for sulfatase activity
MTPLHADRNLIFGILALQMDFISRDQLVAALHAWLLDKSRPLGQVLSEQGALPGPRHDVLQALVEEHLAAHGGDADKSLATLGMSVSAVEEAGGSAALADVLASLTGLGATCTVRDGMSLDDSAGTEGLALAQRRFRVVRPLATGGLGELFVAEDVELHREVALKTLQSRFAADEESRDRFLLEAEITGRLEHPGIVPVYGLAVGADGRPFYAMRLIRGDTLLEAIRRHHQAGPRAPGERILELRGLLSRFVALCNAIAYAHSRGILHRDLKPANVLLGPYGETLVVDWGLAKSLGRTDQVKNTPEPTLRPVAVGDSGPTEMGQVMGTPAYASPEQAAGLIDQLGPASDVYGLGATLYHLLTGQAPFGGGTSREVLGLVKLGQFPPPRQVHRAVPRPLEAVCLKAMALRPQDRYPSARYLAADVENWLADEPVTSFREGVRARLARWLRRHSALATGVGALLLAAVIALAVGAGLIGNALRHEEEARTQLALDQAEALLKVKAEEVPPILAALDLGRPEVTKRLRELWSNPEAPQLKRMRAGLALLKVDPDSVRNELTDWMLEANEPAEMLLARKELLPWKDELSPRLWERVRDRGTSAARRFRAQAALAAFDSANPAWPAEGAGIVGQLLAANSLHRQPWIEAVQPIKQHLVGPLTKVFRDSPFPDQRAIAASVLGRFEEDNPTRLALFLQDANPEQFRLLRPNLLAQSERMSDLLRQELAREPAPPGIDTAVGNELLGRRQANAAVALLYLGQADLIWPLLRHSSDPYLRSELVHRLGPLGTDPGIILARLGIEKDVSIRRALILSLGEFSSEQLSPEQRQAWLPRLLEWYRDDPDAGIHGAVAWLLGHAAEGPRPRKIDWGAADDLWRIDQERKGKPLQGRGWLVNEAGQTFAVLPGPVKFVMGSPFWENKRSTNEPQHLRRIPRTYGLATHLVTVAEVEAFRRECPKALPKLDRRKNPDADGPVLGLTWYEAAQYCRWLSEREHMAEDQMCFPPIDVIEKSKDGITPLELPKNYLARTGYRLPSQTEWDFACRSGAETAYFFGSPESLLPHYVWYQVNSGGRSWPVGQKKPNDFGLFDALGNAWQWCMEGEENYRPNVPGGESEVDREDVRPVKKGYRLNRILCGGSYDIGAYDARCAKRVFQPPTYRDVTVGLRLARTIEVAKERDPPK